MKINLKVSLILNVIFSIFLLGLGLFCLWQGWQFASYRDGRPQGPMRILENDMRVFNQEDDKLSFILPKGTVLQESVPHGAATLGKVNGSEYILIIRSNDSSANYSFLESPLGWMKPYRFEIVKFNEDLKKGNPPSY